MDGLLIDSEPFWKQAEYQVFSAKGVKVTPQLSELTATMTTRQVAEFWFTRYPWADASLDDVENNVIDKVIELVTEQGRPLDGVTETIDILKANQIKIGLATNSPAKVMHSILAKLGIGHKFDVLTSADEVNQGKPSPEIYQLTLSRLGVTASNTIAFEDSLGGLAASVAAGIRTIAIPAQQHYQSDKFAAAAAQLPSLSHFQLELAEQCLAG